MVNRKYANFGSREYTRLSDSVRRVCDLKSTSRSFAKLESHVSITERKISNYQLINVRLEYLNVHMYLVFCIHNIIIITIIIIIIYLYFRLMAIAFLFLVSYATLYFYIQLLVTTLYCYLIMSYYIIKLHLDN